jgi:diaminohydroxyphosphoribosylaminopyrimidine deaminase/5-amino-6-(5-phosphoribosylamino)uracil reductase
VSGEPREPRDPMLRALALARRGRYGVAPNPRVGALVVRGGRVVGEGWHERAGEAHAEARALAAAGERARGATLYVTLEPCAHQGRTPPCVDAVVRAGIARVVAAHRDPDPRVDGRGFERLRAAGVAVEAGARALEAIELNLAYLVQRVLGRPAVTLKWAVSVDGRIATAAGESRWITGEPARDEALALRDEHDAILVGSGTVLADDPRLTRRRGRARGPILRAVADRRLRIPARSRLFDEPGPVVVYTESAEAGARAALEARGAQVAKLERVTPAAMVEDLGRRGAQSVLVEGGAGLLGAFAAEGPWDRLTSFVSPLVIGGHEAPGAIGGAGTGPLAGAPRLDRLRVRRIGRDVAIMGIREECLRVLSASAGV